MSEGGVAKERIEDEEEDTKKYKCPACLQSLDTRAEVLDHIYMSTDERDLKWLKVVEQKGAACPGRCKKKVSGKHEVLFHLLSGCGEELNAKEVYAYIHRRESPENLKERVASLDSWGDALLQIWISGARHDDPLIRSVAAVGLGNIGGDRGLKTIVELVRDPSKDVARFAVNSLAKINSPESRRVIVRLLDSRDEEIRKKAVVIILRAGIAIISELENYVFRKESRGWKTGMLLFVKIAKKTKMDMSGLKVRMHELSPERRLFLIGYIREEQVGNCCDLLIMTLMDSDRRVREAAKLALGAQEKKCKERLISALIDKDDGIWKEGTKYVVRTSSSDFSDAGSGDQTSLATIEQMRDVLSSRPWELDYPKFVSFAKDKPKMSNVQITEQKSTIVVRFAQGEEIRVGVSDVIKTLESAGKIDGSIIVDLSRKEEMLSEILMHLAKFWNSSQSLRENPIEFDKEKKIIVKGKKRSRRSSRGRR